VISVLIADDQDLVREGLRMLLEAEPDLAVAGEAADGSQALAQARLLDPDVILMDIRMPGMNGIEAATRLVQGGSRARIVMLTTFNLDEYVYHALKAGASGFLLKDTNREQLTGAVRAVAAGETLLAPAITRRLIEDFCDGPAPGTPAADTARRLSERELGVVRLVAQGLSNAEIAARLYLSEATVKSHIAHILAKLDLRDRVQIAVHAYERGIVRPGRTTPPSGRGGGITPLSRLSEVYSGRPRPFRVGFRYSGAISAIPGRLPPFRGDLRHSGSASLREKGQFAKSALPAGDTPARNCRKAPQIGS
jgi:DNA-binding NarL/FixJ family response regulator